jgi:ABC-2 type transport system ATP-binding protein
MVHLPETHRDVAPTNAPLAIDASGLHKTFRIPTHRIDSLKERVVRPLSNPGYRELRALNDVSFQIRQGEFFGIVGRNGSGKSTLLKCLASIYRPDAGSIYMAGRLAPFIELGVGFNLELTARENVILNGVMMGVPRREAARRLDAVLDFAELGDFVDLRLKNYSSGMLVRLAFSVMLQADADILLIDEVLAVGDAAFQQKCADAFHDMKSQGKTIVLVTHAMSTIEAYCHRAMLIENGKVRRIGDPAEVGREYLRLNFQPGADIGHEAGPRKADGVRLVDARIENEAGEKRAGVEHRETIRLRATFELDRDASHLAVGFILVNADGIGVFQFGTEVSRDDGDRALHGGDRIDVSAAIENPLAPGRYFLHCGVQSHGEGDVALYAEGALDFVVFGTADSGAVVVLDHEIGASVIGGPGRHGR